MFVPFALALMAFEFAFVSLLPALVVGAFVFVLLALGLVVLAIALMDVAFVAIVFEVFALTVDILLFAVALVLSSTASRAFVLSEFDVSPLAADVSVKHIKRAKSGARVDEPADKMGLGTGE